MPSPFSWPTWVRISSARPAEGCSHLQSWYSSWVPLHTVWRIWSSEIRLRSRRTQLWRSRTATHRLKWFQTRISPSPSCSVIFTPPSSMTTPTMERSFLGRRVSTSDTTWLMEVFTGRSSTFHCLTPVASWAKISSIQTPRRLSSLVLRTTGAPTPTT